MPDPDHTESQVGEGLKERKVGKRQCVDTEACRTKVAREDGDHRDTDERGDRLACTLEDGVTEDCATVRSEWGHDS